MMRKHSLIIALICVALFTCCTKSGEDDVFDDEETIKVSLSVTDIEDNQATVRASLTEGDFYGAKLVEAVKSNTVTIDYTSSVKLINYVKEYGIDIDLPYTNTLTDLRADVEMFSAVIVFDSKGIAVSSSYQKWTVVGEPWSWSDENDAGELDEIFWDGERGGIIFGGDAGNLGDESWSEYGGEEGDDNDGGDDGGDNDGDDGGDDGGDDDGDDGGDDERGMGGDAGDLDEIPWQFKN